MITYRAGETLEIDEASRRSLEITRTLRDGRREGSLLDVIDRTVTSMGSRLLAEWLANPLNRRCVDRRAARRGRQNWWRTRGLPMISAKSFAEFTTSSGCLLERSRPEPRRAIWRLWVGRLATLPSVKAKLTERKSTRLNELEAGLDLCPELRAKLDGALADECPLVSRDGGFIRAGFSADLDNLRELATGGKQWIARYQADEVARTGIPSLKVGFNKVFGYYLEVTHTHGQKVPDHYIRKQTVKNAERYITPELKEYEEKVLSADEKSKELEYDLFCQLREQVSACAKRLQASAAILAELDVLTALATLAARARILPPTSGRRTGDQDHRRPAPGRRCAARRPVRLFRTIRPAAATTERSC